jgi:hypothetical protein
MKTFFAATCLIIIAVSGYSQANSRYQTYKSVMTVISSKNGVVEQWKNDRLNVVLDYKTGEFTLKMTNLDFVKNITSAEAVDQPRIEYTLQGIFPIFEIKDQLVISQNYVVELQLINYELRLNQTINFDLNVTNPGTNKAQYRIFILQGKMYNDEVNLPAFEGYDNEVEIHIGFNGYIIM